jgi:hypothetical protein
MSKTARSKCPTCHKSVSLNSDGTFRAHRASSHATTKPGTSYCKATGKKA